MCQCASTGFYSLEPSTYEALSSKDFQLVVHFCMVQKSSSTRTELIDLYMLQEELYHFLHGEGGEGGRRKEERYLGGRGRSPEGSGSAAAAVLLGASVGRGKAGGRGRRLAPRARTVVEAAQGRGRRRGRGVSRVSRGGGVRLGIRASGEEGREGNKWGEGEAY